MIRILSAAPLCLLAFVAALALFDLALRVGFMPDDTVTLWAAAITAGDGEISLGRAIAAYPTIPFLTTAGLEILTPAGTPTPALLSAVLLALIAGSILAALRDLGIGLLVALAAALLISFHPALLRAAVVGPADMFLAVFLLLLTKGLCDLREQSAAPQVMTVAMSLLGLTFAHPAGAAVAVASIPLLAFAVRPALVANSAINVVVALVFPSVFCIGAFVYVSWVFPGSGWSFFSSSAASLAAWTAGMAQFVGPGITSWSGCAAGLTIAFALVFGAPVAVMAAIWARWRQTLVAPIGLLAAAIVLAAVFTVLTSGFGEPSPLMVAAPVLAAIMTIRSHAIRERPAAVLAFLVLGWFGGAAAVLVGDPKIAAHLTDLASGSISDRERIDALNLGRATAERAGVLIDTFNAPATVIGRGRARGLTAPQSEGFALAMLFARIDTPFVAVPDPNSAAGAQDQLNKTFPRLFRFGAPGYRLAYQNATWRMFERIAARPTASD